SGESELSGAGEFHIHISNSQAKSSPELMRARVRPYSFSISLPPVEGDGAPKRRVTWVPSQVLPNMSVRETRTCAFRATHLAIDPSRPSARHAVSVAFALYRRPAAWGRGTPARL